MRFRVPEAAASLTSLTLTLAGLAHGEAADPTHRILVFSKTAGFRHDSIPDGIALVRRIGSEDGFAVDATEDAAVFSDAGLAPYDAVVFLSTTGDVLAPPQQAALERFLAGGRGFAGVHSAADTESGWPWYGELVGAGFQSHPAVQPAVLRVADAAHASTRHLPAAWPRSDEWYNFTPNPRDRVHVLLALDEATYSGGSMGGDHPIAWCRYFAGGRTWYTGLGHTRETYAEPLFVEHLRGGIRFAAGYPDCPPRRTRAVPR